MQEMGLALHGEIKWPVNNGKFANEPLEKEVCEGRVWRTAVAMSAIVERLFFYTGLSEREATHSYIYIYMRSNNNVSVRACETTYESSPRNL